MLTDLHHESRERAHMAYLFFQPVSPQVYQQQPTKRLGHQEISNGQQTWDLFQFTFTEAACPHDLTDTNPRHYYVSQFTCELPPGFVRENRFFRWQSGVLLIGPNDQSFRWERSVD